MYKGMYIYYENNMMGITQYDQTRSPCKNGMLFNKYSFKKSQNNFVPYI